MFLARVEEAAEHGRALVGSGRFACKLLRALRSRTGAATLERAAHGLLYPRPVRVERHTRSHPSNGTGGRAGPGCRAGGW